MCELCDQLGLYKCWRGPQSGQGQAANKCPLCIKAGHPCKPSSATWELPDIGALCVPTSFHLLPQRDHRYSYYQLIDPGYQKELKVKGTLHSVKLSLDVPLLGFNPVHNTGTPSISAKRTSSTSRTILAAIFPLRRVSQRQRFSSTASLRKAPNSLSPTPELVQTRLLLATLRNQSAKMTPRSRPVLAKALRDPNVRSPKWTLPPRSLPRSVRKSKQ